MISRIQMIAQQLIKEERRDAMKYKRLAYSAKCNRFLKIARGLSRLSKAELNHAAYIRKLFAGVGKTQKRDAGQD